MKLPKELREKKDLGGTARARVCSVKSCNEPAIRSLSENAWGKYVEKTGLKINENKQHKIFLCSAHKKEVNKIRKNQEKLSQKKGFLNDVKATKKGKYFE